MRLLRLAPLALMMFAACGGDDDDSPSGPGDVAAVFPGSGFIGRKLRVEVSGDTTSWTAATTVSFGAGVTVDKVELVSPQALFADLTIAPTAAPGKLDVTVTAGTDVLTLPAAFELQSPITAEAAADFQQGGLSSITITNKDLLNPFDDTQDQNGDFTGVTVASTDPGVKLTVANVTSDTVVLNALIDVNATTTGDITLTSGTTQSPAAAVAVTARAAQVITPGTPANFTVLANGGLLEVTAATAGLLNIELSTTDMQSAGSPSFVLLPASGKWSDLIVVHQNFGDPNADVALDNRVVAAGDKFYLVALELGFGAPGYPATFNAKVLSLTGANAVTDTGDNATPATAQAIQGPIAQIDGTLTDTDDVDCFKITTNAANKKLHVYTTDADGATDSIVTILPNATQTDLTNPLLASTDADFGDDMVTGALAVGTRAICIGASTFVQTLTNAPYKAFVFVEN